MTQEYSQMDLRQEIVKVKDHEGRKFEMFSNNFYIMKAAIRYFAVKQGLSFNSSKIADNFPVTISVAGSCLSILDDLDVVEPRNRSTSRNRYMPKNVDMEKLVRIEEVLVESYEIEEFY